MNNGNIKKEIERIEESPGSSGSAGAIFDNFFDDLCDDNVVKAANRNAKALSDGEIDSDSDHEAIKRAIKKEKSPVEETDRNDLQHAVESRRRRKRHETDDFECSNDACKDSGSCHCRKPKKKHHKKKKRKLIPVENSELPLPVIVKIDPHVESTPPGANIDAPTFDLPKIRLRSNLADNPMENEINKELPSTSSFHKHFDAIMDFPETTLNTDRKKLEVDAIATTVSSRESIRNRCLECVQELTTLEMEPIETQFIYTPTATVLPIDVDLIKMQSPLRKMNNCQFNFSSIRNNVNAKDFGVSVLPNVVKRVASGLGCSVQQIEELIKMYKRPTIIHSEVLSEPISFLVDTGVQTQPYSCIECLVKKVQKPVNTATQIYLSGKNVSTQTTDSPESSYNNLPGIQLISLMTPAAQLALNDFAEMLQTPATGAGDMYKIRDRLLDIYNRGTSNGANGIYQPTYQQAAPGQPIYSYAAVNNNVMYSQPSANNQMYQIPNYQQPAQQLSIQQQTIPRHGIHQQHIIQQPIIQQQLTRPAHLPSVNPFRRGNDPRINGYRQSGRK